MLALFRNNQTTTALLLAAYVGILHLPAITGWIAPPEIAATTDGGLLYQHLFSWAKANPRGSAITVALLVLLQAILVNALADHFRLMNDRNWLPGMMYAFAASCLPDFLFLSPALVAVTFLPVALRRLFSVYKQKVAFGAIFDAAFWVTVATLFHPPAVWFLPAVYFGLFSLRSFNLREQMVFYTGIFAPFFLALTAFFWLDRAGIYLHIQFTRWIAIPALVLPSDDWSLLKTGLIGLILLIVIMGFNVYYYKRLIQVQKYITLFYWFLFAGLIAALFNPHMRLEYGLLLTPTLGVFLAYLFQSIRNGFLAEAFHLVLFAAALSLQYLPH